MRIFPCVIASLVSTAISCLLSPAASAQLESGLGPSLTGSSNAAYYFISKPGEITMPINLWGYVKNPGRYEVPISTDLIQLVSFAGGPLADADLSSVKVTRVVRREGGVRKVEYNVNLRHLDKLDEMALSLEGGDTIFIDNISFSARDVFNVVTTVAVVTAAVANVIYVARQK
jgi:NADH:ubiquinone oxidoreductase subunit F (NADH-binding)